MGEVAPSDRLSAVPELAERLRNPSNKKPDASGTHHDADEANSHKHQLGVLEGLHPRFIGREQHITKAGAPRRRNVVTGKSEIMFAFYLERHRALSVGGRSRVQ